MSFLSKSSDLGLHHQKRPLFRQHFLNRLPLPHGQRSLRPSFSSRSLSPCTMRTPRPTCVSEGKPFRRLLIVSKKTAVRQNCVWTWDTSIRDSVQKKRQKCPRQELNLVLDLRRVACDPAHSKDLLFVSTSPGSRTPSYGSEDRRASVTLERQICDTYIAIVEGSEVHDANGVASSPSRNRTWSTSFGSCHAIRHTHGPNCQYPDLESNQDLDFRRVPCGPLHYRDERADDWIRTSINRFTRAVPFYV